MIRITITILLLAFNHNPISRDYSFYIEEREAEYYFQLNEKEGRLPEYKDSDEDLMLKIKQLDVINRSRRKHRAPPLKLDILACRVANKICREAALNNYVGHWNLKGEKPYHRYAFAGGLDHVSENASGQTTSGRFDNRPEAIARRMVEDHASFMAEKRPNDGHKQTVINKSHNYVGLGFFAGERQFRYYELYIDRYYIFEDIPSEVKKGETFNIRSKPPEGFYFNLLIVYYENYPSPLSPAEISSRSYYNDFTDDIAYQVEPWKMEDYRDGSWYNFNLIFDKPGLYYIQIFSGDKPYKNGSRYTTEGQLQASGIVVKVR